MVYTASPFVGPELGPVIGGASPPHEHIMLSPQMAHADYVVGFISESSETCSCVQTHRVQTHNRRRSIHRLAMDFLPSPDLGQYSVAIVSRFFVLHCRLSANPVRIIAFVPETYAPVLLR